ncbi:MAG TPA: hypothetical protein VN736_15875 [Candidatus Limnocylindrales bacterium]|nr:hypothetical protein [Candidatus Limnocylindrales bacterium]
MLRWLYIQLIWLHPAPFRWRFGDEMLDDFDRAPGRAKPRYIADAVASLARQWLLRPEFRGPDPLAATPEAFPGALAAPRFQTIETYQPRPAALLNGGFLAILSILTAVILAGKGGAGATPFLIGAHGSRPGLLPVHTVRNSAAGDLNTTVHLRPNSADAALALARAYFASMPVLRALDSDGDSRLSPPEIANAAAALRRLDTDNDGQLTAEECGLGINSHGPSAAAQSQLRRQFMSDHPVLAALDANHDGAISAAEINRAAASLKTLDRDGDGYVTAEEVMR